MADFNLDITNMDIGNFNIGIVALMTVVAGNQGQ